MHRVLSLTVALVALAACGPAPYVVGADDVDDETPPAAAPAAAQPVLVAQPAAPPVSLRPCLEVPVAPCYIVTTPVAPPPPAVIALPAPVPRAHVKLRRSSIDPTALRVLRRHHRQIRRCYDRGLRDNPQLAGQVVVRLTVDRDGEVDEAHDHGSTLPDERVIRCVLEVLDEVDFDRNVGSTIVYPIDLNPSFR